MRTNVGSVGDQGENWAITQFTDSKLFRADRFSEERIHVGCDIKAKLLDRDTGKELYDILYIQVKNYTMNISNGYAILDNAVNVWHLKQWEHIPIPTLVVAYDRNERWNKQDSGYWIWYTNIINQIETRDPKWRDRSDDSKVRVKIPVSNRLSYDGINHIYRAVLNHYIQLNKNIKINETAPIGPIVQNLTYNSKKTIELSEGIINPFFIDIFQQILSEYHGHEIISKICKEIKYSESNHHHLEFFMYPKRLSIPYYEILKNSTALIIHTFASSIAYGELNTVFDLILNSNSIEIKSDIYFSRESIIPVFESLDFKPSYILISSDLFVEWMEFFSDRLFFEEKQTLMKFEDEEIPVIFVINDLSSGKVLFMKQDSIESIVKYSEDTTPIINFQSDIPIGPRRNKIDIRVRSDGENIEFVFRTVRSFSLVEPKNIFLLDFSKISIEEET